MKRISLLISLFLLASCLGSQDPAPVANYGVSKGAGSVGVHTVTYGETLYTISQRYNIVMRDIAQANNLQPPFYLEVGQRIKLLPPQEYRVRKGDSLYTVSRIFGVNTSELARLNKLQAPYTLAEGQKLRLPSMTRKTMPKPPVRVARNAVTPVHKPPPPVQRETLPPPVETAGVQSAPVYEPPPPAPEKKGPITAKTPKRSSSKFLKPVEGNILSSYGPKKDGLHNDGINIAAPKGSPVRAAENGVVVYAGNELKGSGNLVLIRHEDRWMTAYAHMDRILIRRGDIIKRGQSIGTVGQTGAVDVPQLHFEVRRGTEAINPKQYLESS